MDEVNGVVLESAVVILSGGLDINGTPLITLPTDSVNLLDIFNVGDILRLMQVFVELCDGNVAVVADLKHDWTEECIGKLTYLLHELHATRESCIKAAYLVTPCVKTKNRIMQRHLSYVQASCRLVPLYDVVWVETVAELNSYIEKSQLTIDYGGTMQYNHVAWVDFQRTYMPVVSDAKRVINTLPVLKNDILKLEDSLTHKDDEDSENLHRKYEALLSRHKVREIIEDCQDAIERLEHPECDPSLIQTHSAVLVDIGSKLKELHQRLTRDVNELDRIMARSNVEHAVFIKLHECCENTVEVEETIALMMQQVTNLPSVGSTTGEAQHFRDHFIETILDPSRDIVSCATSILQDLDCGKHTTPKSYALAIKIAKRLTDALQPFTQHLNNLNECYTRIHLFHVMIQKTGRWKQKASTFIATAISGIDQMENMINLSTINVIPTNKLKSRTQTSHDSNKEKDRLDDILHIGLEETNNNTDNTFASQRLIAPRKWPEKLQRFYEKHPPPNKKHIRLLNRFVPEGIHEKQIINAEILAERVLFILQFLKRVEFKVEDISLIQQWSQQDNSVHMDISSEVTRV